MRAIQLMAPATCAVMALASCAVPSDKGDLAQFLSHREICDHLRGEVPDPSDRERLKEVVDDINKYCAGTDRQLKALKARYAADPDATASLNALEENIEAGKQ